MANALPGSEAILSKIGRTQAALRQELDRAVLRAGLLVAGQAQRNVSRGRPGLKVQSGRLRQSIVARLVGRGAVRIGPGVEYAAIHEFGGVIQHPGGTAYFFDGQRARFVSNRAAGADWPEELRTQPHPIRIPPRPYMGPALKKTARSAVAEIRRVYAGPLRLTGPGGTFRS